MNRLADVVEEVEFLLGTDAPHSIAARLGYSAPKNLARVLHRAERADLARHFDNDTTDLKAVKMSQQPTAPVKPTIESILADASESEFKRTRNLAAKIREQIADLTTRLAEESARRLREERIAELEAEIARLKSGESEGGARACDSCDRTFPSAQGLSMHRRRAHEGFDPNARAAS